MKRAYESDAGLEDETESSNGAPNLRKKVVVKFGEVSHQFNRDHLVTHSIPYFDAAVRFGEMTGHTATTMEVALELPLTTKVTPEHFEYWCQFIDDGKWGTGPKHGWQSVFELCRYLYADDTTHPSTRALILA
jgi:hypothetical protein